MKRFIIIAMLLSAVLAGALSLQHAAKAAEDAPMTDAHIERIRANCVEAQAVLQRVHASDGLLRVNRGQIYELISTKLMTPMNSRIALNRLDPASLVSITADYEQQLNAFRRDYQDYEESMSALLEINCMDQPVTFYDKVGETREKRQKAHQSTLALHKTIGDYRDEFEVFAKTVKTEESKD